MFLSLFPASPILHSTFDGSNDSSMKDNRPMTVLDMSDINNSQRKIHHLRLSMNCQTLFRSNGPLPMVKLLVFLLHYGSGTKINHFSASLVRFDQNQRFRFMVAK